jgi:hypothetical protein
MLRRVATIAIVIALTAGAVEVAHGEDRYTPRQAAKALAVDYLAPLTRPGTGAVRVTVRPCQPAGGWYACWVRVTGRAVCRALVHVRQPQGPGYTGWVPRARCR